MTHTCDQLDSDLFLLIQSCPFLILSTHTDRLLKVQAAFSEIWEGLF